MAQEIEIKLKLKDPDALRAELKALGARIVSPRSHEINLLYDEIGDGLRTRSCALRVRRFGGQVTLTWKGPKSFKRGVRSREELETEVSDHAALTGILQALGMRPVWRYEKHREIWRQGELLIMLDDTRIGSFFEIEGQEEEVRALTRELGLSEEDGVAESYATLIGEPVTAADAVQA